MPRRTKAEAEQTRQAIVEAARAVFWQHGVHRTKLEEVALAAGVTRGAIYWHFRNKIELFFAVRDQQPLPLIDGIDDTLLSGSDDALGSIEKALLAVMRTLASGPALKRTHQIMAFRCEYVDELEPAFARVFLDPRKPLQAALEQAYRRAAVAGQLRAGLKPARLAEDTSAFMSGLMTDWLARDGEAAVHRKALVCIRDHIALRRA